MIDQRRCDAADRHGDAALAERLAAAEGLAQLRHGMPGLGVARLLLEPAQQRALARASPSSRISAVSLG